MPMGFHTRDAIWVATMKADALLGRVSDDYRVQLGATFDWEVTDDDVLVARSSLSPQRTEALVRRRAETRPVITTTPDWDASADLLLLFRTEPPRRCAHDAPTRPLSSSKGPTTDSSGSVRGEGRARRARRAGRPRSRRGSSPCRSRGERPRRCAG
jgi:hypothetical protein